MASMSYGLATANNQEAAAEVMLPCLKRKAEDERRNRASSHVALKYVASGGLRRPVTRPVICGGAASTRSRLQLGMAWLRIKS